MTTTITRDESGSELQAIPGRLGNIRHLAWLPVMDSSGRRLVGLDDLFANAHLIQRLDVRAPVEKAGVLRFLSTVTALIAREQAIITRATAETVAREGFDPAAITRALDAIDDRLWLIHEATPFMQEGRYLAATSSLKTAASIRSTSPGDSSKAWWGRPGDGFATGDLDLLSAPAALMDFWFYSVNGNVKTVLDGVPLPTHGSAAGKVKAAGVRLWKMGENLAATLLMNTPRSWMTGSALPAWAQNLEISGQLEPLIQATITGNATLLVPERVAGQIVFTGAHIGTSLRRGIPPTAADFAKRTAAKGRNKAIVADNERLKAAGEPTVNIEALPMLAEDALKLSLMYAWHTDPQVVFRKPAPKQKGLQNVEDRRALNDITATTSVLHNLQAWYLRSFNPDVPGQSSILSRREFGTELFSIQLKQESSYGKLSAASWLSMPPGTIGGPPAAQEALEELADFAYGQIRTALRSAILTVLSRRKSNKPLAKRNDDGVIETTLEYALGRFSSSTDEIVTDAVDLAVRGEKFSGSHVRAWSKAALTAFDDAIEPYLNARRLPDIAEARQKLITTLNKAEKD